jgi:hypothetical protein
MTRLIKGSSERSVVQTGLICYEHIYHRVIALNQSKGETFQEEKEKKKKEAVARQAAQLL